MSEHAHILIVGQSGSGKTSIARQLLQLTPRAVIIDPQADYASDPGVTEFRTFRELAAELERCQQEDTWRLAYNPEAGQAADGGFRAVMAFVYRARMMERERLGGESPPAVGVFLEEASIYSDASRTPQELDWLIRAGRKAGISTVNVVQGDVDISKSVRRNMSLTVCFRLHHPSTGIRRMFEDADELVQLETLFGPAMRPEYGHHYVTFPPDTDPHAHWREAVDP